ncbi:MAG: DUF1501 domain-containing protein, partial [Pirellulaceae bacterium]
MGLARHSRCSAGSDFRGLPRGFLAPSAVHPTGGERRAIGYGSEQSSNTRKTGRDHWPHAFTALLAGGGVRGGQVYGSTNENGGY